MREAGKNDRVLYVKPVDGGMTKTVFFFNSDSVTKVS